MSSLIFVFDTNVLLSAVLASNSVPQKALVKGLEHGKLAHSLDTLNELKEVLERSKFDKYISREDRRRFLTTLSRDALMVNISAQIKACRDPKDDKYLELAVSAAAQVIVSGDKDLLSLHPFQGVEILTPSDFLSYE
jgi:uncharacterized protein